MSELKTLRAHHDDRQSGTEGIWTFIFIDMIVFGLIFLVFASERYRLPTLYAASQTALNEWFAFANPIILLTSSWAMVEAVQAARVGLRSRSRQWLALVLVLGSIFCGLKLWEYWGKYSSGIGFAENSFFSMYYFITLLHLAHLIGAMMFIRGVQTRLGQQSAAFPDIRLIENVGLFWHFVDVLWIFIVPLLYLIGRP